MNFYEKNKLTIKPKIHIPNERFAQLEEQELRKRVYTGESYTLYKSNINPSVTQRKLTKSEN